jgi:DNA primase
VNEIESVLLKLGFDLKNDGPSFWRCFPIYRESSNATSLRIAKNTGSFIDFSANVKGSIYDLIKLTLGLSSLKEAKQWMEGEGHEIQFIEKKPKIILDKKIEAKYYENLMPSFSFYEKRGISLETLENFECGVCFSGKQNNHLVFVIRDENGDVKGVVGRDLLGGRVKWKKLGDSRRWVFPLSALSEAEAAGEIFLVESIGDMLALWDVGVKNVIVLFGIELSSRVLSIISSLSIKKIHISLNNDANKDKNWGQLASESMKNKLSKVVDLEKIQIFPPPEGDWGDLPKEERLTFIKEYLNDKTE